MTRRELLKTEAWNALKPSVSRLPGDTKTGFAYRIAKEGFDVGFNAAWDALMKEIRPLIEDLRSADDLDALYHSYLDAWRGEHSAAVKRLRELVREDK